MNIDIQRYSPFGIAGGQEVDHTFVKSINSVLITNKLHFGYGLKLTFISRAEVICLLKSRTCINQPFTVFAFCCIQQVFI